MKINKWLKINNKLLKLNNNQLDAKILLSFVIKKSVNWINHFKEYKLNEQQIIILKDMINRRILGEPIAYITGECEFWSLPLVISNKSMIPRIDSEILVEQVLLKINKKRSFVLDLGCGSGALTLALASECPNSKFIGIDYIKDLVSLSQKNSKLLNINNVSFFYSNWFKNIKNKKFNFILSNPPYISFYDPHLLIGDLKFEPLTSLAANDNGLFNIKLIASQAKNFLYKKGWLIFEHGWNQSFLVKNILINNNFINVFSQKDYNGYYRVTGGMKK